MKENVRSAVTLAPPLALLLLFFFIPLILSVKNSVYDVNNSFIGLSTYIDVISDPEFISTFNYTLEVSLLSTILAVFAAVIIAMAIRGTFTGKKLSLFLFQMNASIPHMSVAAMMLFLLLPSGFISSMAYQLGLIDSYADFPTIVQGTSGAGVIISFTWKFAPFIGLSILSVMQSAAPEYEDQAATLGVGPWNRFRYIILPMIGPAIISASIVCFAFAFGSYEVPVLLGLNDTLAVESYNLFHSIYGMEHLDRAYVISNIITFVTLMLTVVYFLFTVPKKRRR
jgi:putative spermidine/putrescine transport system permease protein